MYISNTTAEAAVTLKVDASYVMTMMMDMFLFVTKYNWVLGAIFGIPGNSIALCITCKKQNRRVSYSNYMSALAAADLMVLISNAVCNWLLFWGLGDHLEPREIFLQ